MRWGWAFLALAAAACTSPNERICSAGERCTEATAPFCDLDGVLGPTRNTCVAVGCAAGEVLTCAGDVAYVCNAAGDSYDRDACALGCSPDGTRCADLAPANGLAAVLDAATSAPAVELIDGDVLDVGSGEVRNDGAIRAVLPGTLIAAPSAGAPLIGFAARSLVVRGEVQVVDLTGSGRAIAFAVHGPVSIAGTLALVQTATSAPPGSRRCGTPAGRVEGTGKIGGGGGGHATPGAASGGFTEPAAAGVAGGAALDTSALAPLHGGCEGGAVEAVRDRASWGGGAVQITSRTSITLSAGAAIEANGALGLPDEQLGVPGSGGGAGGAILLEAPRVTLAAGAVLAANGAGGKSGSGRIASPSIRGAPSLGRACGADCSPGGTGGHVASPTASESRPGTGLGPPHTGGGGGAAGTIRIRAGVDGVQRADDAVVSPRPALEPLETR